jgi:hypothetical protein
MLDLTPHYGKIRLVFEECYLEAQAFGMSLVIGVHSGDEVSAAGLEPQVESRDQSGPGVSDDPQAGLVPLPRLEDSQTFVYRAIIYRDDLETLEVLVREAAKTGFEKRLSVPDGEKDRHFG